MDFKQLEAFVYVVKLKKFFQKLLSGSISHSRPSVPTSTLWKKELDTKLIERGTKICLSDKNLEASFISMR